MRIACDGVCVRRAAAMIHASDQLRLGSGMVLAVPIPEADQAAGAVVRARTYHT